MRYFLLHNEDISSKIKDFCSSNKKLQVSIWGLIVSYCTILDRLSLFKNGNTSIMNPHRIFVKVCNTQTLDC
jgi:hypothetical protein